MFSFIANTLASTGIIIYTIVEVGSPCHRSIYIQNWLKVCTYNRFLAIRYKSYAVTPVYMYVLW